MSTHCWQNGLDGALAVYYNDNGKDRCRFSFISPECLVNEQGFPKEKQTASDAYVLSKELYDHFSSIYKDQACYCVMLLSEHYYAEAYYIRGNAYLDKGKYDRVITDYNKAIELNPNFTLAYMNRGFVYLRKGNYDHAIEDGNKAVELKPDYPEAYSNRGEAWLHLQEWEKARSDLTAARERGVDIIASFHNDYESVADFEQKNGVKLPSDLATMLTRQQV